MTEEENKTSNVVNFKDYKEKILQKLQNEHGDYEDFDEDSSDILMIDLDEATAINHLNTVFPEGIPEDLKCSKYFLMGILEETESEYSSIDEVTISELPTIEDIENHYEDLHVEIEEKEMIIEDLLNEIRILNKNNRKLERLIRELTVNSDSQEEPKI